MLKMLRLLCFFRLLFDWDAVKTKRKGVGEWRVRSGYANLCCVIKKKMEQAEAGDRLHLVICPAVGAAGMTGNK